MKRLSITLVLIAVGVVAWLWYLQPLFFPSELSADPQVAELQVMQKKTVEQVSADANNLPDDQQMGSMRDKIRELSDDQRREFFRSSRETMMVMMEARMKRFFTLSPEEQKKQLDEDIDRMQKMRESGRGFGGRRRGGEDGERKSSESGNQNQNQNAQAEKSGESRRQRYSQMTDEEKNERRKGFLNHSTPERRAMFTEYRRKMNERMRERGMEVPTRRR